MPCAVAHDPITFAAHIVFGLTAALVSQRRCAKLER
jgi:hypothetical protein